MYYSPQAALLQGMLLTWMTFFHIYHSWKYDQFKPVRAWCLSLVSRPTRALKPGERISNCFHAVMRLIYLCGLPLYACEGFVTAHIKYALGFLPVAEGGIPIPCTTWPERYAKMIMPLEVVVAVAWSGEILVHLEEIMFWLYLVNLKPKSRPWFQSLYFKIWFSLLIPVCLSLVVVTIKVGENPMLKDNALRTAASGYDFVITIPLIWIVSNFNGWLANLKNSGAPTELILRLYGFGELNKIRVVCRVVFFVSHGILGVDGLTKSATLNNIPWVSDTLFITALFGFSVQCMLTMLIFFPRNHAKECGLECEGLSENLECSSRAPLEKPKQQRKIQAHEDSLRKPPSAELTRRGSSRVDRFSAGWTRPYGSRSQPTSLDQNQGGLTTSFEDEPSGCSSRISTEVASRIPGISPTNKPPIKMVQTTCTDVSEEEKAAGGKFRPSNPTSASIERRTHGDQKWCVSSKATEQNSVALDGPCGRHQNSEKSSGDHHSNRIPERESSLYPFQIRRTGTSSSNNPILEETCLIHPAIRNYRSPIDIMNIVISEESQNECMEM